MHMARIKKMPSDSFSPSSQITPSEVRRAYLVLLLEQDLLVEVEDRVFPGIHFLLRGLLEGEVLVIPARRVNAGTRKSVPMLEASFYCLPAQGLGHNVADTPVTSRLAPHAPLVGMGEDRSHIGGEATEVGQPELVLLRRVHLQTSGEAISCHPTRCEGSGGEGPDAP